jgi:hypothetical protein
VNVTTLQMVLLCAHARMSLNTRTSATDTFVPPVCCEVNSTTPVSSLPGYCRPFMMEYVKPDGSGELITVWNVTLQDAPGGVVDYEMEEEDLMKAIKLYTEFKAMACNITKEPRIDC